MQQQHRSMSTYPSLLEPTCRRRQLPPTPIRRSSSPRILPTPPPISPDYRCPSAALLERRPSGRLLPRPPTAEPTSPQSSRCSPQPPPAPPSISPVSPISSPQYSHRLSPQSVSPEPLRLSPDPIITIEENDVLSDFPVIDRISTLDSLDHAMDTPDGICSNSSSLSPSIEQLASKSSSDCDDPLVHGLDPSLYGPNAPTSISPSGSDSHVVVSSSSFINHPNRPTGLGLLHCSLQHFPVRKRLRFSILKIDGLAGQLKPEMEIHAVCRVSIPNLKTGKEQISEVKRGRDPVYNQEFFFDNVGPEDLDTKSVTVAAFHQGNTKIIKDILIGEATVPLREIRELNTKKEVRVIEELKQQIPKKLGKIHISSCIEKESRRLSINLKKADDLPRWAFTGAPDVCIKITCQQGDVTKTKSSRILKSTTTAVYNEAVMFLFDPSKNALAKTRITISVHDMQRTCTGDDLIGCAYLGILAVDKTEIEQWKNTVEHMNKEYKGTHHLKSLSVSPPVHVAEAAIDGDDIFEDE